MDLADLSYLVACADARQFTLAARTLKVEVSTISRRVSNLEDELGLALFVRTPAGLRITRAGSKVLNHAQRALSELDAMRQISRQFALGKVGEIKLGIRVPPVGGAARTLLTAWHEENSDIAITVVEGNERELALGLSEHRLDAALMAGPNAWPRVTSVTLYRERMMAVLPAGHPLATRSSLDWKSLSRETIMVQCWDGNHTQREFYATFLGNGARFQEHPASKQTIMGLIGSGFGITLATESQAEASFPGVVFRSIEEENGWLEFGLVWLPEIEDPLVGRFVAFMRDESRVRNLLPIRS